MLYIIFFVNIKHFKKLLFFKKNIFFNEKHNFLKKTLINLFILIVVLIE